MSESAGDHGRAKGAGCMPVGTLIRWECFGVSEREEVRFLWGLRRRHTRDYLHRRRRDRVRGAVSGGGMP